MEQKDMGDFRHWVRRAGRFGWLLVPVALAATLFVGMAGAAPASTNGVEQIGSFSGLAAGASTSGWWLNPPRGRAYYVDVQPDLTNTRSTLCQLQVTSVLRLQRLLVDPYPRLRDEVVWTVKNVGTQACGGQVFLGWQP
jgi:hypothetical protein